MRYLIASLAIVSVLGCKRSDDRCDVGRKAVIASLEARIADSDARMKEILGFMKTSAEVHFDEVCANLGDEAKTCVARFAEFDKALGAAPKPEECDVPPMQRMEMEPEESEALTKACNEKWEAVEARIRGECNAAILQLGEELSKREWSDRQAAQGE